MKYIIFLSVIFFSLAAHAQEKPVQTLQSALQHAYEHNPTLNAARRELDVIKEKLPQARAGWYPTIEGNVGVSSVDVTGNPLVGSDTSQQKEASISLDQPIYRGGSTFAATDAAKHTIKAQEALLFATQQDVLSSAVEAYMNVARDENLLQLSMKNREVISEQLRATNDRFEQGSVTKTDVKQAEARLAGAEADVIRLEGSLDASRAVFKQIIGFVPNDLSDDILLPSLPKSLAESHTIASENAPNIQAAKFQHKAQKDQVDNVFGELLPQISLRASHSELDEPSPGLVDDSSETVVGLFMRIPLYQAGSVRSRVREAEQEANRGAIQIRETELRIEQEVISSWRAYESAKAEIKARKAQVEAATIARQGVYMEAEQGSRTILDTLDADQELLDAQVDEVIAKRNEIVAAYDLGAVLGLLTPQALKFAEEFPANE